MPLQLEGGGECRIRLIDCVGYMVEGAMGHEEDEKPRMVKSPWFEEEIPFDLPLRPVPAKVIRDHSTIGIVVTTDGSISEIPREKLPARRKSVWWRSWKRWANPLSSCSTAPARMLRRQRLWPQSWNRPTDALSCR